MLSWPWALVLALPAALAWWNWARHGHGRWWRAVALLLIVLAAGGPELALGRGGSDVVLVLDRSWSLPQAERDRQEELVRLVAEQRRSGDRLAVIAVGGHAALAQGPQATARPRLADAAVPGDGSDLAAGLDLAAALLVPGRSARVVLVSDGEATGLDPRRGAMRLAAAAVPLDVLPVERRSEADAAIIDVEVPGLLRLGESFIGAARLTCDTRGSRSWRIRRGERIVAEGRAELEPLRPTVITFADRPAQAGIADYQIELEGAEGFALTPRFVSERLLASLVPLAESAGVDPEKIQALLRASAGPAVQQLADPAQRAAAVVAIEQLIAKEFGAPVAALVAGRVETALAAAVVTDSDRQPLNNRARAVVRVIGGERVMVVGGDGNDGNVARALRAAGLVVVTRPEGRLTLGDLAGCTALVLDEVAADHVGAAGQAAIADWVEHLGGGLVMLGGRRSFGAGGWRKSPVERVLPVTLELRDEHRKLSCAIAIAIDVSGSMGGLVADGRPKVALAGEGAASVIELLGPRDQVAVFAVDSAPTTIVALQPVDDPVALGERARGIQVSGGGIFVYEALAAAGTALLDATAGTRHLVLFADAADAEEPGDYVNLIAGLRKAGITVSVIGLGSEMDCDAKLLMDVATRGGGRCHFAEAAEDLPRLFAQETVLIARSAWIDEPAALAVRPAATLVLGQNSALAGDWPTISGYNLVYARERADVLAHAQGDPGGPAVASWRIGTGRAAAVTFDADDPKSAALLAWPGYAPLLAGLVRWTAGDRDSAEIGRLTAQRLGATAVVRLELDPDARSRWPAQAPRLALAIAGGLSAPPPPSLEPVDDGVYEARITLTGDQPLIPSADCGGTAVVGPALCLPYPAEAEPRHGLPSGRSVLERLAHDTGGTVRADLVGCFANPPSPGSIRPLAPWLVALALLVLVTEIAVRRMRLAWSRRRTPPSPSAPTSAPVATPLLAAAPTVAAAIVPPPAPTVDPGLHEALRQLKRNREE